MFSVAPRSRKKLDAETRALSTAGWSLSQQACSLHMLSFLDLSSPSLQDNNDFHNYQCVLSYVMKIFYILIYPLRMIFCLKICLWKGLPIIGESWNLILFWSRPFYCYQTNQHNLLKTHDSISFSQLQSKAIFKSIWYLYPFHHLFVQGLVVCSWNSHHVHH